MLTAPWSPTTRRYDMDKKEGLIDRVKDWQSDSGLTNYEVSVMCGCSERTYERFRQGGCDNGVLHTVLGILCGVETTETLLERTGIGFTIFIEDNTCEGI